VLQLHQPVVLKNVPSVNKLLDEIKHLVQITPLRFPHGVPEHESDFNHVMLRSNGEMIVKKKLPPCESSESADKDCARTDKWKLNHNTVSKELEEQLRSYSVHAEYFKAKYVYRRNQDGKEYRYSFNKNTPKYEW
jgi:large subunit ribosomal protein L30